jgi:myo-inositol-1(or 4)-monophosphatase
VTSETNHASEYEKVACAAARAAGRVLRRRFREATPLRVQQKGLHDYVTEVDHEAEAAVLGLLTDVYPEHVVMSEESSPDAQRAPLRWVVDPLDGTTNFIHGVPTFAVCVALEDPTGPLAAAVYDPLNEEMFHAHRGGGARLNGTPISCSDPEGMGQALIATGFPFRELSRVGHYLNAFEAFIRTTAGLRRAGSAAIDLAYTACGRYDGFWEVGLSRWDIAAGILLVQEAGGTVTDIVGGGSYLDSGDIVAAGPKMHAAMLDVTREAFAPE